MKIGLTLGKYAPLHQGHQLVIDTALSEMDRVIVIIYDAPETTSCPLPVRANWIRKLYPSVEIIEAWDGPTTVSDAPEMMKIHEEYILRVLKGRTITHFYSSEFYGDHVSKALGAVDRRIDPQRRMIPISATAIRNDPFSNRQYLSPLVYNDIITRVVFLGAPSTGKSTLAEKLASMYSTVWMPEFGREYWEKNHVDRRLTLEQLVEIAVGHGDREARLASDANRYMFIDTDATTTYMFSLYYHGAVHPRLTEMANETMQRCDLFFLCEDDIPYDDTWDRSGELNRAIFQKQIRADLLRRKIPYVSLNGSLKERIMLVTSVLECFDKFQSFGNNMLNRRKI
jgi:HTH-type transcriptional regulator, transcriptional repressor of NAD biosynthesis genes